MTEDELVELNEARLMNTWTTWACVHHAQVTWIASRTKAQAETYALKHEWEWKNTNLGMSEWGVRHNMESFDVVLP